LSSQNEKRRKQYAEDKDYREAILARNRAFRVAHRDEINARAREAYAKDDGYRARKRRSGNKWYSPEKRLAQVYGLSPQDYDAMLAEQEGVCAICKTRPDKPLFVDHSHATGKVRGLLCRPCNFSLGFMRDDPRLTAAATKYLLKDGGPRRQADIGSQQETWQCPHYRRVGGRPQRGRRRLEYRRERVDSFRRCAPGTPTSSALPPGTPRACSSA
jgi:hypothetical protein